MLFMIISKDHPDSTELRANTRPKHLQYLASHNVHYAGPILSDDETKTHRVHHRHRGGRSPGAKRAPLPQMTRIPSRDFCRGQRPSLQTSNSGERLLKTAIVSGVGPIDGLGAQLCVRIAKEGLHVLVAGRTQSKR